MSLSKNAPLYELADAAPWISNVYNRCEIDHSFSNDDSPHSFMKALEVRTQTETFRQTANPVAMVVGESAISTTIHFMPERTILIVDREPNMLAFMSCYVHAFRVAEDAQDWLHRMGLAEDSSIHSRAADVFRACMNNQINWWESSAPLHKHALTDPTFFKASQRLFRSKAIIPWQADITNSLDMEDLGYHLNKQQASVTLLNLSNVIPMNRKYMPNSERTAKLLSPLPLNPDTPILTTSTQCATRFDEKSGTYEEDPHIVLSTGPFGGLDDLRTNGGNSFNGPVAVPEYEEQSSSAS